MNILLVGEEAAGTQTLKTLLTTSHKLVAVLASETKGGLGSGNLWTIAQRMGCPTWPAKLVKDPAFADRMRAEGVDLLLNVHSLFVINKEVVAAPRLGAFNMHPGPLPRYAGLNAPSWALSRGEATHGVTIHWMLAGIDTGPIAYQTIFDVTEDDTGLTVSTKCVKAGLPLLYQLLNTVAADVGAVPKIQQDLSKREYFGRDVPHQGFVPWERTAREVRNFIRACDYAPFPSPWGVPKTILDTQELGIAKASLTGRAAAAPHGTVGTVTPQGAEIACGDEWLLVTSLKVQEKYSSPQDLLRAGMRVTMGLPTPTH